LMAILMPMVGIRHVSDADYGIYHTTNWWKAAEAIRPNNFLNTGYFVDGGRRNARHAINAVVAVKMTAYHFDG